MFSQDEWFAIVLTLKLAAVTTAILLMLGTPIAWWLSQTQRRLKPVVEALVALPLVLPPTVLGFYLLFAFAPGTILSNSWFYLTSQSLIFSFEGLVIGSVLYSLPFFIQPLQLAFDRIRPEVLYAALYLGASRLDRFFSVVLPMTYKGLVTAAVLGFAHTVGEFGIILMIGGNIPGETKVLSILLYEQVELMRYQQAHVIAGVLLLFSFLVLFWVYQARYNVRDHA